MDNNLKKKLITGVLLGSMVLSLGTTAFASENTEGLLNNQSEKKIKYSMFKKDAKNFKEFKQKRFENREKHLDKNLDELLENDTLSKDTVDKVKAYIEKRAAERKAEFEKVKDMTKEERNEYWSERKAERKGEKINIIDQMVEENIITKDEAEKIEENLQNRKEILSEKLDELVEDSTLSKDKVDKIKAYIEERAAERKAEFEEIKDMSKEEREEYFEKRKTERKEELAKVKKMTKEDKKAYLKEKKGQKSNLISQLIEEGIITTDEAEKIQESLKN